MQRILLPISFLLLSCSLYSQQPTLGLLLQDEEAFPSYTLFSNNEETYLIDNCGLIINQWTSEYRPGRSVYLRENGQLLRTAELDGAFPISGRGGRFELFDWNGELIWWYELNTGQLQAHHDIAPLPNGNFLCLVWEKLSEAEAQALGRQYAGELWSEAVYELEIQQPNDARIVWEWHLTDHLVQHIDETLPHYGQLPDYPERVDINYTEAGSSPTPNWVHLNAIDYDAQLDQMVLSSRLFSEVWVIDHSTSSTEASTGQGGRSGRGGDLLYRFGNPTAYGHSAQEVLGHQHDARWIRHPVTNEVQIMVFNNDEAFEQSSVKIWIPPLNADDQYIANPNSPWGPLAFDLIYTEPNLYSNFMSGAQLLPNGHLFICEGMSGHFYEVDTTKNVFWEYLNPVNPNGVAAAQGATVRFNQTFRATKYGLDYPAFAGKTLTPDLPVEINPWESDCYVPGPVIPNLPLDIIIAPTVFQTSCTITSNQTEAVEMRCYDIQGRLLFTRKILTIEQEVDFSAYPAGMYLLLFTSSEGKRLSERILVF